MQDADGAGEQAEHTDHGKAAENGKDEGLGHLARDHGKGDGGDGKPKSERNHEADIAFAACLIGGRLGVSRWSVDVGHGSKLSDSISLRAAHCGVAHGCSSEAQIHERPNHFWVRIWAAFRRRDHTAPEARSVILAPWLTVY